MKNKLLKNRKKEKEGSKSNHKRGHPDISPFEYNRITDNIFIGTNMCCQTHFNQELLDKGIKADISLEEEKIDQPYGVDFFIWIPIKNRHAPTMEKAELFITTLDKLLSGENKVYVHCKNGHGRAPTMVAAYFISKGMGVSEAIDKIKERRPAIHLNNIQLDFLEKLSEKYNK